MRRFLATLFVVLGSTTIAQDHFVLGSLGYSSPSFDAIKGSAQVFSGGLGYHGFFGNSLYFGLDYSYDYGEGHDCNFAPCLEAILERKNIGAEFGYNFGQFTPFVSVYSSSAVWDTTEILRRFGRDREEDVVDYGVGTWIDGANVMPNLWLRFSADGFVKDKGVSRSITGTGVYRLRKNLLVGAEFSVFIAEKDRGSKTSFILGWRF